jgi:AraC family transcriptional regulator of adaptative response / DNA-3-methyladenine glycosylase II
VPASSLTVALPCRAPFAADELVAFLAARAIPGVEHWDGERYHRALRLAHGHGIARVAIRPDGVSADLELADARDADDATARLRHLLGLDVDPGPCDDALAADGVLAPLVEARPGLRVPGSVDPFETAVRAVVGQQISVAGARTVAGRIVAAVDDRLAHPDGALTHVFPSPEALADLDPAHLPMPQQRKRTIAELSRRVAAGTIVLDRDDLDGTAAALVDVPGIGPWTAGYVRMRGLGDPDVFLPTDLGVKVGLDVLGLDAGHAERWRPYRSCALHHLWSVAAAAPARSVRGG